MAELCDSFLCSTTQKKHFVKRQICVPKIWSFSCICYNEIDAHYWYVYYFLTFKVLTCTNALSYKFGNHSWNGNTILHIKSQVINNYFTMILFNIYMNFTGFHIVSIIFLGLRRIQKTEFEYSPPTILFESEYFALYLRLYLICCNSS